MKTQLLEGWSTDYITVVKKLHHNSEVHTCTTSSLVRWVKPTALKTFADVPLVWNLKCALGSEVCPQTSFFFTPSSRLHVMTYFWYLAAWVLLLLQVCVLHVWLAFFKHQQELPLREGARQERKRKKEVRGARRASDRALRLSPQMVIVWNSRVMISCCALSVYLADAVGYELIKRNISLDIVSTLRSDYGLRRPVKQKSHDFGNG